MPGRPYERRQPSTNRAANIEWLTAYSSVRDEFVDGLSTVVECGWLTGRYGVSWQIVPAALGRLLSDPDRRQAQRGISFSTQAIAHIGNLVLYF